MISRSLRKKLLGISLILCLSLSMSGCVYIVVGSLGALGGYVVSPDTVEGLIEGKTSNEVWEAIVEVVSAMGVIEEQNAAGGIMIARISKSKVTITRLILSDDVIKVTVKARRSFLPKIRVGQAIYVKIANYLEQ